MIAMGHPRSTDFKPSLFIHYPPVRHHRAITLNYLTTLTTNPNLMLSLRLFLLSTRASVPLQRTNFQCPSPFFKPIKPRKPKQNPCTKSKNRFSLSLDPVSCPFFCTFSVFENPLFSVLLTPPSFLARINLLVFDMTPFPPYAVPNLLRLFLLSSSFQLMNSDASSCKWLAIIGRHSLFSLSASRAL